MYIALIIIGALLFLVVIPHFVVSYFVFLANYKRWSDAKVRHAFDTNEDYEKTRPEMLDAYHEMEQKECEIVSIQSFDGLTLRGRYYNSNSSKTVIFFHGLRTEPTLLFSVLGLRLLNEGFNVLYVYSRGHGISDGKYTSYGYHEKKDAVAWVEYVNKVKECNNIYLYGASMGATTIALASPNLDSNIVKGLVIDAAYTTVDELIKHLSEIHHIPTGFFMGLVRWYGKKILKVDFRNDDTRISLASNKIPTLFTQGSKDNVVIIDFFNDNYDKCASTKEKILVEGAGHAITLTYGGEPVIKQFITFLNTNGGTLDE